MSRVTAEQSPGLPARRLCGQLVLRREWGTGECQYCRSTFVKRAPQSKTCPGCTDTTHGMKRL